MNSSKKQNIIDCTNYSEKAFLQLLKGNPKYQQIIAHATSWEQVLMVLDSLGLRYSEKQISYVREKQWR